MKHGRFLPSYVRKWEEEKSVQWWRSRIDSVTFAPYWTFVYRFFQYIQKGPDEAKEWAKGCSDKYEVLNEIQAFVNSLEGLRWKSKMNAYTGILSFFAHNRVPLPDDPSFKVHSAVPKTQRMIKITHLLELIGLSVQPYRSMILVKWMSLQDTEGLNYINLNHAGTIVNALREGNEVCRLDMPGRKQSKNRNPYFTFIGKDALDSLRDYFDRLRGWPKPTEPVWLYGFQKHNPSAANNAVTKIAFIHYWSRLLRKAGLIPKKPGKRTDRYGFNAHNTRDLAITKLEPVVGLKRNSVEFWTGHEIDKNGYLDLYMKQDYVLQQYLLAQPELNIISNLEKVVVQDNPETVARIAASEAKTLALTKMMESLQKQIEAMQNPQ